MKPENIKVILDGFDVYLDHIAVATKSIKNSISFFEMIGLEFDQEEEIVKEQKVKVRFANIDQRSRLELLEPIEEDGAIYHFLQKKGPGIHHMCFKTTNLPQMMEALKENGLRLIYDTVQTGAHGMKVNFIHPKSTGGILVELSQDA
ncbi:methylmalonyl-CoA epimerase [Bacteriovoracaceae bacterium]|nr:methylmalonyl-CoA epimerase [Bacteriovoracaceae bacterium]